MRYAIVSDIHANLQAWDAVKEDIGAQGIEAVVCLGDIIGYGPRPVETLDSVSSMANYIVLGNHEAVIEGSFDHSQFNDEAWKMIEWTGARLDADAGRYFEQLPLVVEMDAGDCKTLFVHGSSNQPEAFNYILDEDSALEAWHGCEADLIFAGHTHEAAVFVLEHGAVENPMPEDFSIEPGKKYIVNVGSVGLPRESDTRASYCIFDTDAESIFFRRVSYDFEAFRKDVLETIGDSDQSRHVLSYFKETQHRPVVEQLDFTPATESQLLARPVAHGQSISFKAGGKIPQKQFRIHRSSSKSAVPRKKTEKEVKHGVNIKLWALVCGFFLMVAIVAIIVAFSVPGSPKIEKPEEAKKEIVMSLVEAKSVDPSSSGNSRAPDQNQAIHTGNKISGMPPAVASSSSLDTDFGNISVYRKVSGQNSYLPEGWNETSSWGNPVCNFSFQTEGERSYLRCIGKEKGRIQIFRQIDGFSVEKQIKVGIRARGAENSELAIAITSTGRDWRTFDSKSVRLSEDWKEYDVDLVCGPIPAEIPICLNIYARSPGSLNIMHVKAEGASPKE